MRISGSSFHRAAACPGSTALPRFYGESNEAAERGTLIHKFLEDCVNVGREEALKLCDASVLGACDVIDIDSLPAGNADGWRAEVAYAYNWKTGESRVIGEGLGRDYPDLEPDEIPGTADAVGVASDKVFVYDYKTGRGHVDPAEASWQLKFLGLAAARAYGRKEASVGVIRIYDGVPNFDHAHFDAFDLADIASQIRVIVERAIEAGKAVSAGKDPELFVGSHCKYCPSEMSCKARMGVIVAMARNSTEFATAPIVLTPEEAGSAWVSITLALEGLTAAKENLKQLAMSFPFPLPNGKVIAAVETSRETINADVTENVVTQLYGIEAAMEAVEVKKAASKERLKNVVRTRLQKKQKLGETFDSVMDEIRKAGGANTNSFYQVKEITPKNIIVGDDAVLRRELPEEI